MGLVGAMPLLAALTSVEPVAELARLAGVGAGWAALVAFVGWGIARFEGRRRPGQLVLPERGAIGEANERLRVETEGDAASEFPLAQVRAGNVKPRIDRSDGRIDVELELEDGDVLRVSVKDVEEGFEILSLAGVDVSDQKITIPRRMNGQFTLASLSSLFAGSTFAAIAVATSNALYSSLAILVYLAGMGLLMKGFLRIFGPGEIVVGADGISVGKWRKRLIPIGELAHARLVAFGEDFVTQNLILERHEGVAEVIKLGPVERATAALLASRINRAIALAGSAAGSVSTLDRGDKELELWRDELRRAVSGAVDYRGPRIPRVRVVETLEDPKAPPERRLGAAIALAEANDPEARRILLRVAGATADDELADALRETAEGKLSQATANGLRR